LINKIVDNNEKIITAANTQVRSSGIFILILGVVFCLFGFLPLLVYGNSGALSMGILGLFFCAYGLVRLVKKSQYYPSSK